MRVVVHPDSCVGAGQCVRMVGAVFAQNADDSTVVLLQEQPDPSLHQQVRQAAEMCPSVSIEIEEDDE